MPKAENGFKTCPQCKKIKNVAEFCKDKYKVDKLKSICKECQKEIDKKQYIRDREKELKNSKKNNKEKPDYVKNWRKENKELCCEYSDKYRYKLKKSEIEEIRKRRKFDKCMICGVTAEQSRFKRLCIDHNHENKEIRGFLCDNCNTALGLFKDSIKILEEAKKYLENPPGI
jgi:cupin superfamily acireductone dioxygenase involved in methionine salvage